LKARPPARSKGLSPLPGARRPEARSPTGPLAEKRITLEQLQECTAIQDRTGQPLDDILLETRLPERPGPRTAFKNPALPPEAAKALVRPEEPPGALYPRQPGRHGRHGRSVEVLGPPSGPLGWRSSSSRRRSAIRTSASSAKGRWPARCRIPASSRSSSGASSEGRPFLVMPLVNGAPPKSPPASEGRREAGGRDRPRLSSMSIRWASSTGT